jgi:hypothetical protein
MPQPQKNNILQESNLKLRGAKVDTVEHLRKMVELNFCNTCFEKYKEFIEPTIQGTIQSLLSRPLADWIEIESEITQIVMKSKGVFKGSAIVITLGKEDSEVAKMVDVKAFKAIKKWPFFDKIKYLYEIGILQDASYKLLDKARETRNRLHDLIAFTDSDYELFHSALLITNQIWTTAMFEQKDISIGLRKEVEKSAKQWLENQT